MKSLPRLILPLALFVASGALATPAETSTLTEDSLKVQRTEKSEDANAFTITISGNVLLGVNACMAKNATAALEVVKDGNTLVVSPVVQRSVVEIPEDPVARRCPLFYSPVYRSTTAIVEVDTTQVDDVVVKNVGNVGHDVSILHAD